MKKKGKEAYFREKRNDLQKEFEVIFKLGNHQQSGQRIAVALLKAQELGIQVPPAIFNFSQCQIRIQNALEEMNGLIKTLQDGLVSATQLDCYYVDIATNQLTDIQSTASPDENAIERAKKEYSLISEEDAIATLDEQIEKNKTVEDVYREYEKTYHFGVDDALEKIKDMFARKKIGKLEEKEIFACKTLLMPFFDFQITNTQFSRWGNHLMDALQTPEYDEEKVKAFLEELRPFSEPGQETRQRFKQVLGAYYTASKEHAGEEQMAQLRHEFHQAL